MIPFFEVIPDDIAYNPIHAFHFMDHLHDDLEILFLSEGTLIVTIDGIEYRVGSRQFLFIWPQTIHSFRTPAGEKPNGVHLIVKPSMMPYLRTQLVGYVPSNPQLPFDEMDLESGCMVAMLIRLLDAPKNPMLYPLAGMLVTKFLPDLNLVPRRHTIEGKAKAIIDYISKHYSEDITLEDVAQNTGINKYWISKTFSGKFNTSFRSYLNAIRMSHAGEMLTMGEQSVTYISYECGFSSLRTFNRNFVAYYGMTPTEYRHNFLSQSLGKEQVQLRI